MEDKRNIKAKIWVYAVVLFTSAFIVLLVTAYSQIKQQRNIDDFKTQISKEQNENKKFQLSYANAQEMIGKLTGDNEKLSKENKTFLESIEKLYSEISTAGEESKAKVTQYEKLSEAQTQYLQGNVVQSAEILQEIDVKALNEKGVEAYNLLSVKAYSEAGRLMFDEGYELYQKEKYTEAIEKFLFSRDMAKKEDYSDNCLYYLAYAQYRTGQTTVALELMKELSQEYPSSSFVKYAQSFIKKVDQ